MPSGSCASVTDLPPDVAPILLDARRAVMSTLTSDGGAHSVPVVFVVSDGTIVSPIDNKPKQGRELQRVTNITRDPRATLLVDRWDEDWTRLGWVMVRADAEVAPIGDAAGLLRARYSQYNDVMTTGERALFLHPTRISWWTWAGTDRADT